MTLRHHSPIGMGQRLGIRGDRSINPKNNYKYIKLLKRELDFFYKKYSSKSFELFLLKKSNIIVDFFIIFTNKI